MLLAALISPTGSALAQTTTVANYTFDDSSLSSSDSDTNSTASDITDNPTGTNSTEFGRRVSVSTGGTPATSIANAWSARSENNANDTFFSFTITPASGATMTFDALNFDAKVQSTLGGLTAFNYNLYWSVDDFTAAIGNATGPSQVGAGQLDYTPLSMDLSALAALTAAVTFRLDPVSAGWVNGALSQRRGAIDNVVLTVLTPTPTPTPTACPSASFDNSGSSSFVSGGAPYYLNCFHGHAFVDGGENVASGGNHFQGSVSFYSVGAMICINPPPGYEVTGVSVNQTEFISGVSCYTQSDGARVDFGRAIAFQVTNPARTLSR